MCLTLGEFVSVTDRKGKKTGLDSNHPYLALHRVSRTNNKDCFTLYVFIDGLTGAVCLETGYTNSISLVAAPPSVFCS